MQVQDFNKYVGRIMKSVKEGDAKTLANLRKGIAPSTQQYAYPYVLPLLPRGASEREQEVCLLVAALIAAGGHIASDEDAEDKPEPLDLGAWLGRSPLSDSTSVESRVKFLHTQDLNEAALSMNRLITFVGREYNRSLDWFSVARTLFFWGNGVSESSLRSRMSVARGFYNER